MNHLFLPFFTIGEISFAIMMIKYLHRDREKLLIGKSNVGRLCLLQDVGVVV